MKRNNPSIIALLLVLTFLVVVIQPTQGAHKPLSFAHIQAFIKYVGEIPGKIENALNEANEVLEEKYEEIDEDVENLSNYLFSPLASTGGVNARNLEKLSQVSTKEGGKVLANGLLKFGDVLKPTAETLAALTADVPDETIVAEAWIDFAGSAGLTTLGASLASAAAVAAGTTASAPVLAFGGFVGAVIYGVTGDKITDAAGDKLADIRSNETSQQRQERKGKCLKLQQQLDNNLKMSIRVNDLTVKRCLDLGVDIVRSRNCPQTMRWHKFLKKCATKKEYSTYCKNKYPGSVFSLKSSKLCDCPKGVKWLAEKSLCANRTYCNNTYPGSVSSSDPLGCACQNGTKWNKKARRCACPNGTKWNNNTRSCKKLHVPPQSNSCGRKLTKSQLAGLDRSFSNMVASWKKKYLMICGVDGMWSPGGVCHYMGTYLESDRYEKNVQIWKKKVNIVNGCVRPLLNKKNRNQSSYRNFQRCLQRYRAVEFVRCP